MMMKTFTYTLAKDRCVCVFEMQWKSDIDFPLHQIRSQKNLKKRKHQNKSLRKLRYIHLIFAGASEKQTTFWNE